MRYRSLLVSLLLVSTINADPPNALGRKLIFSIGGGLPFSRTLSVELRRDGAFHAIGEGMPITDSGLTKFEVRSEPPGISWTDG